MVNDQNWPDPDATRINPPIDNDATRVTPPVRGDDATQVTPPVRGDDATRSRVGPSPEQWTARASVPPPGSGPVWPTEPEEPDPYGGRSWLTPVVVAIIAAVLIAAVGVGVWLIYRNSTSDVVPAPSASVPSSAPAPSSAPPTSASPSPSPSPSDTSPVPVLVPIPPVGGDTEQSATEQLRLLGLKVVVQHRVDPSVEAGRVIGTVPPPGTSVPPNSTVVLIVAVAPSPSPSPSPSAS